MAGIDDVARLAGVSTATVSRALSGRGPVSPVTRQRVEAAAESLGYVVSASASSLASGRMRNVGVLVPFLDKWFFSTVLRGISAGLMRRGYDITLYILTADLDERRAVFETFLKRHRIDGVVAISIELGDEEISRLAELDLPVIAIGEPNPRLTTLTVDEIAVARLATDHLISLGHRFIAHIGASAATDTDPRVAAHRRRGFESALAEAGIPADPAHFEPADFTIEGGFRAAERLLDRSGPLPTAIFAASDEMAVGAILAARERGIRIPEDLSIVGVDGHDLGGFFGLTTVEQFPRAQGERAADAILEVIEDPTSPHERGDLPFELVVRTSTARR